MAGRKRTRVRPVDANDRWRHPAQPSVFWEAANATDPAKLHARVRGDWWDLLRDLRVTLVVSREYEHFLLAMNASAAPRTSFFPLPHPSGVAVAPDGGAVWVASTRNPNQVFDFVPAAESVSDDRPLLPRSARFYPGSLYLHDLAFVGSRLHANAVGRNAVVRLDDDGSSESVWWPRVIDAPAGPRFDANYLQLNSIAAGRTLRDSFFTATTDRIGSGRRIGHRDFPVDGRGVVFSGRTREPVARGLTRPHSARLHSEEIWLANSGYGEVGTIGSGRFDAVVRLPGWTRGLAFVGDVALAGTSRVLPRFHGYAPGLDPSRCVCGVHAIDTKSGNVIGSVIWPEGDQIFAVETVENDVTKGFPFQSGRRSAERERMMFFSAPDA